MLLRSAIRLHVDGTAGSVHEGGGGGAQGPVLHPHQAALDLMGIQSQHYRDLPPPARPPAATGQMSSLAQVPLPPRLPAASPPPAALRAALRCCSVLYGCGAALRL